MHELSGFHGYKSPEDWKKIESGIGRPTTGTQGNDNSDWKAFYLAPNSRSAAGYATHYPADGDPKKRGAGGILFVKVQYVTVEPVTSGQTRDLTALRQRFSLPEDGTPFMEQLGARRIVLQVNHDAAEDGVLEYIIPWDVASNSTFTLWERVAEFTDDRCGAEAAEDYSRETNEGRRPDRGVREWNIPHIATSGRVSNPSAEPTIHLPDPSAPGPSYTRVEL